MRNRTLLTELKYSMVPHRDCNSNEIDKKQQETKWVNMRQG